MNEDDFESYFQSPKRLITLTRKQHLRLLAIGLFGLAIMFGLMWRLLS